MDYSEPLNRIEQALHAAADALQAFTPGKIESEVALNGFAVDFAA